MWYDTIFTHIDFVHAIEEVLEKLMAFDLDDKAMDIVKQLTQEQASNLLRDLEMLDLTN